MSNLTPSRIARKLAGDVWPDVQAQRKLAPGIFDFSCAGHGGIVAVLDSAELPAELVDLARKHGKTELVGDYHGRLITSERYTRDTFDRMRAAGMTVLECWAGEEDCDFALIALASPAACAAMAERMHQATPMATPAGMYRYARENAERWNPEFVADMDTLEVGDQLAAELATLEEKHARRAAAEYEQRKKREAELLAAGEFVRDSAIGGIGTDRVAVTFRDRDGREATGEVSQEIYRALPLGEPATPADFGLAVCSIGGILWAAPIREAVPA